VYREPRRVGVSEKGDGRIWCCCWGCCAVGCKGIVCDIDVDGGDVAENEDEGDGVDVDGCDALLDVDGEVDDVVVDDDDVDQGFQVSMSTFSPSFSVTKFYYCFMSATLILLQHATL
jgi:hypothetical protein